MAIGLPVVEIFGPTIQGEGGMIGVPTYFVRLGGCDYRCDWCDSMHAVDEQIWTNFARWMSGKEITREVQDLVQGPKYVTISGGNPAIHKKGGELVDALHGANYLVALETQGTIWQEWIRRCDVVTVSPKGPSSGNVTDMKTLFRFLENNQHVGRPSLRSIVKIVVKDGHDLGYANMVAKMVKDLYGHTIILQPCHVRPELKSNPVESLDKLAWLIKEAQQYENLQASIVLPQLHVLLWGNEKGR